MPGTVTLVLSLSMDAAWLFHSREILCVKRYVLFYLLFSIVHIVVHELGHYVGGALSGYHLLLIQIGYIRLSIDRNSLCKFSMERQFDSQCVMIPKKECNPAYRAYLFGGILGNILFSALGIVFCIVCKNYVWGQLFFSGIPKIVGNTWPICDEHYLSDGGTLYLLDHGGLAVLHDYAMYLKLYEIRYLGLSYNPRVFDYQRHLNGNRDSLVFYHNMLEMLNEEQTT